MSFPNGYSLILLPSAICAALCARYGGSEDNNAIDSVKGVMDLEASKRLIEEMAPAHPLIQPNMYGEPLLVPNLRERLKDMRDADEDSRH